MARSTSFNVTALNDRIVANENQQKHLVLYRISPTLKRS